jgi:hypothetical protein
MEISKQINYSQAKKVHKICKWKKINLNPDILNIIEKLQASWNCQLYLLSLLLTTKPTETHSFPNKHKKTKRKSKIADTIG